MSAKNGSKIKLQMKKGSKWVDVQTFDNPAYGSKSDETKRVTVKKLKAKTGYDSILKLAIDAVSSGYIVPNIK